MFIIRITLEARPKHGEHAEFLSVKDGETYGNRCALKGYVTDGMANDLVASKEIGDTFNEAFDAWSHHVGTNFRIGHISVIDKIS
jgi:hypothetical protein